jgi:hypothetical protein
VTERRFTRTTEDFTCLVCGHPVTGDGYTNHCPSCLWSRHVDVHPGDRSATCRGLMAPVGLDTTGGRLTLEHRCQDCGHTRRNRVDEGDDEAAVLALTARLARDAPPAGAAAERGGRRPGRGGRRPVRGRGPG